MVKADRMATLKRARESLEVVGVSLEEAQGDAEDCASNLEEYFPDRAERIFMEAEVWEEAHTLLSDALECIQRIEEGDY